MLLNKALQRTRVRAGCRLCQSIRAGELGGQASNQTYADPPQLDTRRLVHKKSLSWHSSTVLGNLRYCFVKRWIGRSAGPVNRCSSYRQKSRNGHFGDRGARRGGARRPGRRVVSRPAWGGRNGRHFVDDSRYAPSRMVIWA